MTERPEFTKFGIPLSEQQFCLDMIDYTIHRHMQLIADLLERVSDSGISTRSKGRIAIAILHTLDVSIMQQLLEVEARAIARTPFADLDREQKRDIIRSYLEAKKASALEAFKKDSPAHAR